MKLLNEIFSILELDKSKGLIETKNENWLEEIDFSDRIKRVISKKHLKPDALFCFDNKPLILFYLNPLDKKELHKAIWNFNESPIVIIVENTQIEIFNGYNYIQDSLSKIGGSEKLNDFKYFELVTGRTWEKYQDELKYENRVDYHLLSNIKAAINELVNLGLRTDLANALIGKSIFTRYLIDRKVKIKFGTKESELLEPDRFYDILENKDKANKFFTYLEEQFNGNLFKIKTEDYSNFSDQHYLVLSRLLKGDEISTGQMSLFNIYNFEILPVEFISNVYESFIGKENQKTKGAYYTPLFLVDYILKETVETHLDNNKDNYSCKILDPACGSGIFLVETLRKLIEKYNQFTDNKPSNADNYKQALKDIVLENIFGIDDDQCAINVAIFSIYLTLLDYQEPSEIETFKFPPLLNINFFKADFFNTELEYNEKLKNINFDFIVGNPPWKGNGIGTSGLNYLKDRKKKEKLFKKKYSISINNGEIAEGFILRSSDFANDKTKISFIIRSSILYNLGYNGRNDKNESFSKFRQYWLEEFFIDKVFELAPVRHEVFDKSNDPSIAPAAIIFYRYANGNLTDSNILEHITLKPSRFFTIFKVFTITRNDIKKVVQKRLKDHDWLWKILVYGNYLDFNFIKRLKEKYQSIKEKISDETLFLTGTGVQFSKKPKENSEHLIGIPFIETTGVEPFFLNPKKVSTFNLKKVGRRRDERLFHAPLILIRNGLNTKTFTTRSAISESNIVFKKSITAITLFENDDISILRNILGLLSSILYPYIAINTFSSIGIEREQTKDYEKFNIPYVENSISDSVIEIELIKNQIYKLNQKNADNDIIKDLKIQINNYQEKIDVEIAKHLEINEVEKSLIDFAIEITLPMVTRNDLKLSQIYSEIPFNNNYLKSYASIFLNRFESSFDNDNRRFIVEIWQTKQIIGMFFKVIPISEYSETIIWKNVKNESDLFQTIIKLSSKNITDSLFIQKDIRGFEKDYFYIFKPNEKRLWHKAIAYLDVEEFADAILKAGRDAQ